MGRLPRADVPIILPEQPVVIFASPTTTRPVVVGCGHNRTEEYTHSKPNGDKVDIWRCQDCGAQQATPHGE